MTNSEIIKECRVLAKYQGIIFRRLKAVSKINGKPCYKIESGVEFKVLHQGNLNTIWAALLSELFKGQ
tara:strand:+ start:268 stop:471 length:204 start_codon:yes stop_codon:yes gene_type:complete